MIIKFNQIVIKTVNLLGWLGMFAVLALMILISVDTLLRYVFNNAFRWTYDLSEYLMVGITYLAVAYTELREDHVTIDIILNRVRKKTKLILNIINRFIMLGLFILITYQCWIRTIDSMQVSRASSGPAALPQAPVDIAMFIGCLALCLLLVSKILGYSRQLFELPSESVSLG